MAWAVKQGITTGTAEDTFSPEAPCTQGQILTFLWRSAGSPTPAAAEEEVSPLPPNFNAAIRWAREKGIFAEDPESSFSPQALCTRGQIVTFLHRALQAGAERRDVSLTPAVEEQPSPSAPQPLQTLRGEGSAHSFGLDGSAFTSEEV